MADDILQDAAKLMASVGGDPADIYNTFGGSPPTSSAPADPKAKFQSLVNKSKDTNTVDFNPYSKAPEQYFSLDGKAFSREDLMGMDGGREIAALTEAEKHGRRGFGEAVTDFQSTDLTSAVPGLENVYGGSGALRLETLRRIPDILKRMQSGEAVSNQDRIYAKLYQMDAQRKAQQNAGGVVGDMVRTTPSFGTRMWLETQAIKTGAKYLVGLGAEALAGPVGDIAAGLTLAKDVAELGEGFVAGRRAAAALKGFEALPDIEKAAAIGKETEKIGKELEQFKKFREARLALETKGTKEAGNFFQRSLARSNNELLGIVSGHKFATWKEALGTGLGEASVGALHRGLQYGALDELGQATGNILAGRGALDGRAAMEKEATAAESGDERLGKYAEWLALGDTFRNFVTLQSGEGLSHMTLGAVSTGMRQAVGAGAPQAAKDWVALLREQYGSSATAKKTLSMFEGEAAEVNAKLPEGAAKVTAADIAKAKDVSRLGVSLMQIMAKHDVDSTRASQMFKEMGYQGWSGMMLLSAENRFLGGLYGADGGEGGLEQAYADMRSKSDSLTGEAIAFTIPSLAIWGAARLGAPFGSKVRQNISHVREFVSPDGREGFEVMTDQTGRGIAAKADGYGRREAMQPILDAEGKPTGKYKLDPSYIPPDINQAVNALEELSNESVAPKGSGKIGQRLFQGFSSMARFVATGDPSQFSNLRTMLHQHGVDQDMIRAAATIKDSSIREHLRKKLGSDFTENAIPDKMWEEAAQNPEVKKATRAGLQLLLEQSRQEGAGKPTMSRQEYMEHAKKYDQDPEAFFTSLDKAVKDGTLRKVPIGPNRFFYARVAEDGKGATEAALDKQLQARNAVFDSLGITIGRRLTNDEHSDSGIEHDGFVFEPHAQIDNPMIERYARIARREIITEDDRKDVRESLERLQLIAQEQQRVQTNQGVFRPMKVGDKWQLTPLDTKAETWHNDEKNAPAKADFASAEAALAHLKSVGLDPNAHDVKVIVTPHRINLADNLPRLAWEHRSLTHFSPEEWATYKEQKRILAETHEAPEDREDRVEARAKVKELEKRAEDGLQRARLLSGDAAFGRSKIGSERLYYTHVGAYNEADRIVIPMPNKALSVGHMVEEAHEMARRNYRAKQLHPAEVEFYSALASKAKKMAESGEYNRMSGLLSSIADLYKVSKGSKLELDQFSKAMLMLNGFHTWSNYKGKDLWAAPAFEALRKELAKDPELQTKAAAFMDFAHKDVHGYDTEFDATPAVFRPPEQIQGYAVAEKGEPPVRPRDLLHKLEELREANKKRPESPKPEKKETPPAPRPDAPPPQTPLAEDQAAADKGLPPVAEKPTPPVSPVPVKVKDGEKVTNDPDLVTPEIAGIKVPKAKEGEPEVNIQDLVDEMVKKHNEENGTDATEKEFLAGKFCAEGPADGKAEQPKAKKAAKPKEGKPKRLKDMT